MAERSYASKPHAWGPYWFLSPSNYGERFSLVRSSGQDKRCLASQMRKTHRPKAPGQTTVPVQACLQSYWLCPHHQEVSYLFPSLSCFNPRVRKCQDYSLAFYICVRPL